MWLPAALAAAEAYIEGQWLAQGYSVAAQRYTVEGVDSANLEITIPGSARPDEIVVVGAHYDTVPGSPGADDNASGVAALLEIARLLRRRPRRRARCGWSHSSTRSRRFSSSARWAARFMRKLRVSAATRSTSCCRWRCSAATATSPAASVPAAAPDLLSGPRQLYRLRFELALAPRAGKRRARLRSALGLSGRVRRRSGLRSRRRLERPAFVLAPDIRRDGHRYGVLSLSVLPHGARYAGPARLCPALRRDRCSGAYLCRSRERQALVAGAVAKVRPSCKIVAAFRGPNSDFPIWLFSRPMISITVNGAAQFEPARLAALLSACNSRASAWRWSATARSCRAAVSRRRRWPTATSWRSWSRSAAADVRCRISP